MELNNINQCLITLENGFNGFSKKGMRYLFGNKKCAPVLDYTLNEALRETKSLLTENQTRISISGVQDKCSMKLERGKLKLTDKDGTYILKPKPHSLLNEEYVPINEHVTMRIAAEIFKINTARCGLILFSNHEPAYITKRFDVGENGVRYLKEDFASVLNKTEVSHGKNYKYEGSYLDLMQAIDLYVPASSSEKEKLYQLILFNYLLSNGDAHIKNFSLISFDLSIPYYQLAPAYDLMCTSLHIQDGDLALSGGLYEGDYQHPSFSTYGVYGYDDFVSFGEKAGIKNEKIQRIINSFFNKTEAVQDLVNRSFLSTKLKEKYISLYLDKLARLQRKLDV